MTSDVAGLADDMDLAGREPESSAPTGGSPSAALLPDPESPLTTRPAVPLLPSAGLDRCRVPTPCKRPQILLKESTTYTRPVHSTIDIERPSFEVSGSCVLESKHRKLTLYFLFCFVLGNLRVTSLHLRNLSRATLGFRVRKRANIA